MQIHGPSTDFAATDVTVELNATRPEDPFITILWPNGVRVYLGDGEADYLIKVILQAKDMLAAHRNAVACHAGIGEYVNGTGLPVAEDDGGDGDDTREPYCLNCLFTVTAAGQHMYPDGVLMPAHEMELGWREPVGRPVTQAGRDLQADALAAERHHARDALQAEADAEARKNGLA